VIATTPQTGGSSSSRGSRLPLIAFSILLLVILGVGIWLLIGLLQSEAKPSKQVVEIQVIRPPPPPPPEIEEEPPPPEFEEEEVEIPEPEPLPDLPDLPDAPPPESLGLDAEGVAGTDAFGLAANRGGRGLIGGSGQHRWYAQKTKDQVSEFLARHDKLRSESYKVRVLVWVDELGNARFRLATSSGNPELDDRLVETLAKFDRFQKPPPPGLPQPISIRIVGNA